MKLGTKGVGMQINGETKLTGIIGYPLRYTLSPIIQNAAFKHLGLNWCYVPLVVERKELGAAVQGLKALGFVGVNITMPYKEQAMGYLDEIASYAKMVGAVNTIRVIGGRMIGYNTDGYGFLTALEKNGNFSPAGREVVIIGAGGAARSVAVSLASAKVAGITIVNRTACRAEDLSELIGANFSCSSQPLDFDADLSPVFKKADLVVNATPIGMDAESKETPVPVELIEKRHLVYDLVYRPAETLFLREAKEKGARTLGGLNMLIYQAAASFEIWTETAPPVEAMRAAVGRPTDFRG